MLALHHLLRRTRLLSSLCLAALAGCGPGRSEQAADRALDYLEGTDHELGTDVVLAVRIYAIERDDARAAGVSEALHGRLSEGELARYGSLLARQTPAFAAAELDPRLAGPTAGPDDQDDRIAPCLDEVLACTISDACLDFASARGRGGYVLTHQAVWLLFAHWTACETPLDLDARRREIAADLAAEMALDPTPSDLAFERTAMLGHLGFAPAIETAWIDGMLDAQDASGCWLFDATVGCHPHPTALALWTLAHAP